MQKTINEHKFAFIICTNNDLYLQECIHYLNQLIIPDGYETDLLTIYEAASMTSGYNEGMASTDARYKIYLHQDVFIVNRFFLLDILSIFQSDPAIGMIGMVGYPIVSPTGIMWHSKRIGALPLYGGHEHAYPHADYKSYRYSLTDGISDAALIDGLMMITSQDLPWDDTTLKEWHFYDAFQSMNFLLHGYRVVVPVQKLPWFIHDDGMLLSMWSYNKYRKIFMEKYAPYLGKSHSQIRKKP
ncbi:MAG: hypothetical protein HDR22_02770 [Lachnospiraceae bacterium]|nr:hypothetical protein [Lachnospiraceae bacterium]